MNRIPKPLTILIYLLNLAAFLPVACTVQESEIMDTPVTVPLTPAGATPTSTVRPTIQPTEIPVVRVTAPLPGEEVLETDHFQFYVQDDFQPVNMGQFAQTAEAIYTQISQRMEAGAPEQIILSFQPPGDGPCRPRGATFIDDSSPRVTLFADEQTENTQIEGVLAHELVHVIHIAGMAADLDGDRNLTEGLATWISRDYWTAWQGTESLAEMVRGYLASGDYVPLAEADVFSAYPRTEGSQPENCLALRDSLYTQWASFVGYLIEAYGWHSFLDLMASAAPQETEEGEFVPTPADYLGIYGKALEGLEEDWLAEIRQE